MEFGNDEKSHMRLSSFLLVLWALLSAGCSIDETPADIAQKLIPEIAQELIQHHDSARLEGMTSEITAALAEHSADDTTYAIGAPDLNGETGISFFEKQNRTRFLALGLDLKASETSYIISAVSFAPAK